MELHQPMQEITFLILMNRFPRYYTLLPSTDSTRNAKLMNVSFVGPRICNLE